MKTILLALIIFLLYDCSNNDKVHKEESNNSYISKEEKPSTYWINRNYAICLEEGRPPCDCMSENEILMLYIDRLSKKIHIETNIFFYGMDNSFEYEYNTNNSTNIFIINEASPFADSISISIPEKLYINYNEKKVQFEKYLYYNISKQKSKKELFLRSIEMSDRLAIFNANVLLNFTKTNKVESTKIFFSLDELDSLIRNDKVSMSCSDDYHYNSIMIKGDTNRFFHVEFGDTNIILYDLTQGRTKGKKLDLTKLERQFFYK